MKNVYTINGDEIHVTARVLSHTTYPPITKTIRLSLSAQDIATDHRIRIVDGIPVTTYRDSTGTERGIPLANLIAGQPPGTRIIVGDGDVLNLTAPNLKLRANTKQNEYDMMGEYAYLKLIGCGQTVYVDTDDVPRLQIYQWTASITHGKPSITAKYYHENKKRSLILDRYVLGIPTGSTMKVRHLNGDIYDVRKANLSTYK